MLSVFSNTVCFKYCYLILFQILVKNVFFKHCFTFIYILFVSNTERSFLTVFHFQVKVVRCVLKSRLRNITTFNVVFHVYSDEVIFDVICRMGRILINILKSNWLFLTTVTFCFFVASTVCFCRLFFSLTPT